jgi:hypothetical protein
MGRIQFNRGESLESRMLLFSFALFNISFFTWSVQLISLSHANLQEALYSECHGTAINENQKYKIHPKVYRKVPSTNVNHKLSQQLFVMTAIDTASYFSNDLNETPE